MMTVHSSGFDRRFSKQGHALSSNGNHRSDRAGHPVHSSPSAIATVNAAARHASKNRRVVSRLPSIRSDDHAEPCRPPRSLHVQPVAADVNRPDEEPWAGYNLMILFCCLAALGLLATGDMGRADPEVRSLLDWADTAICGVFLIDFVVSLVQAENRCRYFITWGWIDILSAIPALDIARWGRAARVLRILRVIRGIKVTRVLFSLVVR
jgi:hypothetical protein